MWHQTPASPVAEALADFNGMLTIIITVITVLVFALLVFVIVRFNHRANPTPSRTTHNTLLEVAWTTVPVLILIVIAIPSFRILYFTDRQAETEMTLKIIGRQWYWDYEYPDYGDFTVTSYMVADEDITEDQRRVLDVDNPIYLPVGVTIQLLVTGGDVIHSWGVPSLGFTQDAVPGRVNEFWVRIEREGVYYGQCRELCGTGHAFMPIVVRAVSKPEFDAWIETLQAMHSKENGRKQVAFADAEREDEQ